MGNVSIAVIGGGSSGLFVSALLNNSNADIFLFEKNDKLGKKILASGNGKCNFSNINSLVGKYNDEFANGIVDKFTVENTLNQFSKMGLIYKSDDQGRCYPVSECASSVLDCLKMNLNNVNIMLESVVRNIVPVDNRYKVICSNGKEKLFDYVVCCSGSLASNLGSEKAYSYLNGLNINITPIKASLTPVIVKENVKLLSGVRIKCKVQLVNENNCVLYSEDGEVIFKDNGLSGIAVFNATSIINRNEGIYKIVLDISNNLTDNQLKNYFKNRRVKDLFKGFLNDKLGQYIKEKCNVDKFDYLNDSDVNNLIKVLKNLEFAVVDLYPVKDSQVCNGGVSLSELNDDLSLKKYPQIFIGGELMNIDGMCGGYNLQFAWSSAGVIANSIKERLIKK